MNWRTADHLPQAALLAAVIFGPLAFGAVEPWAFGSLSILVYLTASLCALRRPPDFSRLIYRTVLPAVGGLILIGLLQRLNPRSILEPMLWVPMTVSAYSTDRALWLWTAYAVALWCAPQALEGLASVRRLMTTVFWLGVALAIVGVIQDAQYLDKNIQMIYGLRAARYPVLPFGPYYNRDHAASLLIMAIFCGVGLFWDRFISVRRQRERPDLSKVAAIQALFLFGIAVCLLGVFQTRSRGALAALLLTGLPLSIIACRSKIHRFIWLAGGIGVASFAISMSPIAGKLSSVLLKGAFVERFLFYRGAADIIRDFPWLGIGLGAFQQAFYPYQPTEVVGLLEHLHCDWLELFVQTGGIGLALYSAGIGMFLRSCLKALMQPAKESSRGLALGGGAAVVGFMLHGLVDFGFQMPANAFIFFVLLAGLGALAGSDASTSASRGYRIGKAGTAFACVFLILSAFSVPPIVASVYHLGFYGREPAAREMQLSKAIELDAKPRYYYELAKHHGSVESRSPGDSVAVLRQALANSEKAVRRDPASPGFRSLQGSVLWRLGRVNDGRAGIAAGVN